MTGHRGWLALIAGLALARLCGAAETPRAALLVLAKSDHVLSIVDPATLQVVGRVPSGPDPHEVAASADGRTAYISNYGGGAYHTITVVDLVAQKALETIDLGALNGPHGLQFAGGELWFTAEGAKAIGRWDPRTSKIDWIMGTGQGRTHMLYVFPDLMRIVTSNISSGTLTFLEKHRDWDETVVPVGPGAEGFDISQDGREIWAANAGDGTISIVSVAERKVVSTLQANVKSANRLKFTPDGKLVLVSALRLPELAIFDAATRQEVKRVKIGRGAAGILMDPHAARAFVACSPDDYVAVIDLKTLSVVGHIQAGKQPDGMAWAERKE